MPIDPNRYDFGDGQQPPTIWKAVTLSDSVDLDRPCRCFVTGDAGAVKVTCLGDGNAVVLPSTIIEPKVIFPGQFTRFWSTGTTATIIWIGY